MPGPHDVGGKDFGPIERADHERSACERRVDGLLMVMIRQRRFRVDELRRAIEELPERDYMTFTYYQKWLAAMRALLVEKSLLSDGEIDRRLDELRRRTAA